MNDDGLNGLLSAVLAEYATVQEAITRLESKASSLATIALALAAIAPLQLPHLHGLAYWLTLGAIGIMLVVVVLTAACILTKKYHSPVMNLDELPDKEREKFLHLSSGNMLIQLAADAQQASMKNKRTLQRKVILFDIAAVIFFAGFEIGLFAVVTRIS